MGDLISRQAAIDALNVGAELLKRVLDDADIVGAEREKYEWGLGLIESYISDMKEIPSAQPEKRTEERTETHTCDLISRQAAMEAIENTEWYHLRNNGVMMRGANSKEHQAWYKEQDIYKALEQLPSAQPEIVRCKECTFYRSDGCFFSTAETDENGFCSWAERRTDD